MIDVSVLFALCAFVIYGATQVLAKSVMKSTDARVMVAMNFLTSMPIYIVLFICALLFWNGYLIHPEYILFAVIGASTARGGYYIYLEALEKGTVSMVGSVTAAFPAITAILAVVFLEEKITFINAVGIAFIILSMIGLSYFHGRLKNDTVFSRSAFILSIATLLIWGFGGIFIKLALDGLPLIAYLGIYPFILPPIAFAYLRHKKVSRSIFFPKWTIAVIGAIIVAELWQLGYFAETSAISHGSIAIVFPMISAYPIVTIIGARVLLKEKLANVEWIFILMVIIGIILTSIV